MSVSLVRPAQPAPATVAESTPPPPESRPVRGGVFALPLTPTCPVWCVSDHTDPLMDGCHVSRSIKLVPPPGIDVPDNEMLYAELFVSDDFPKSGVELSLNHAGSGELLDAAAVDRYIGEMLTFVGRLRALRAQMGATQ